MQSEVLVAKGAARITSAQADHTEFVASIRREVFIGPAEAKLTTAERVDRPLVCINTCVGDCNSWYASVCVGAGV